MPGVFSKTNPPKRPGAYFNFEAAPQAGVPLSQGVIVAVGFVHDWGPMDVEVAADSFAQWQAVFGASTDTPGYTAVRQVFQGEGLPGRGGAGRVLGFRYGGATAAKASLDLANTTPVANALALLGRYEGARGNQLSVTVQDYSVDATSDELIVYLGTIEVERYQYVKTDVAELATQINDTSNWLSATANTTGVGLAYVTSSALTGGNNGAAPAAADLTALLAVLETSRFGAFVLDDIAGTAWSGGATATSILASIKSWSVDGLSGQNVKGKRFMTFVGGAVNELLSAGTTRSTSLNDPNFVNIGFGSVEDSTLGVLSSSQLAPRMAGIYAQRADSRSMTFARLSGVDLLVGPTEFQIVSAFDAGMIVLSRDNVGQTPVRIERGLTTFTTKTDDNRPLIIYRSPKYVRTMHGIEMEFTEWAEANIIGQVQVNDSVREQIIGELTARLRAREEAGVLQGGSTVVLDPDPPITDQDEHIALLYGIKFGRSVEQIWNTVTIA